MAHNQNAAEKVEDQLLVARRVKVKFTKGCLLEFCFCDCHFASSSPRRKAVEVMGSTLRCPCCSGLG